MNCVYCSCTLPDKGFFCPECANQVKCKHCNELLVKSANACVYCGEAIIGKASAININTIEFTETETSRTFRASFTDTVGQNVIESLGLMISNRLGAGPQNVTINLPGGQAVPDNLLQQPASEDSKPVTVNLDDIPAKKELDLDMQPTSEPVQENLHIPISETKLEAPAPVEDIVNNETVVEVSQDIDSHTEVVDIYEIEALQRIISLDEHRPVLIEYKLKAKSKREYCQRLTILLLYLNRLLGQQYVPKKTILDFLEQTGLGESNIKSWLNRNAMIAQYTDDLELLEPGIEVAKKFVKEIFDDAVPDVWQLAPPVLINKVLRKPGKMVIPINPDNKE